MDPWSPASLPPPPPPPSRVASAWEPECPSREEESPAISAAMFAAGLVGNVAALGLLLQLRRRRRGSRRGSPGWSPFRVLVRALVLTDLLGTCLLSPMVLASYGARKSLVALDGGEGRLCLAFAFAMSFFSLATMGCLGAMATERSLALGAPYFYQRLPVGVWRGALPVWGALAAAFCALPLLGFGRYVQYCPGTWCFIQMHPQPSGVSTGGRTDSALGFSLLYASLLLLLILAVLLGNLSAIRSLAAMHRRRRKAKQPFRRRRNPGASEDTFRDAPEGALPYTPRDTSGDTPPRDACPPTAAPLRGRALPLLLRPRPSLSRELDHLLLLAIMTLTFAVCSLPFTIRAFMNSFTQGGDYKEDLRAMRFLSINSIIDPWVFIILRPSVLRLIRSVVCCRMPFRSRTKNKPGSSVAKPKPMPEVVICRQ